MPQDPLRCAFFPLGCFLSTNPLFQLFGGSAFAKEFLYKLTDYNTASWAQNFVASIAGASTSLLVSAPLHEKAWGAEHTSTLDTVNNLAVLYKNQDKMAEAEEMYIRALKGYEKAWGAEHTSTLNTVNTLAILYSDQGKMAEAEEMLLRALKGKEKAWVQSIHRRWTRLTTWEFFTLIKAR